jgi:hypothetical protein
MSKLGTINGTQPEPDEVAAGPAVMLLPNVESAADPSPSAKRLTSYEVYHNGQTAGHPACRPSFPPTVRLTNVEL